MRLSRAHVATPIAIAPATPKEIRITPLGLFVVDGAIFSARIGYKIIEKKSAPCAIRRKREVPRVVFASGGNKILGNGVWDFCNCTARSDKRVRTYVDSERT